MKQVYYGNRKMQNDIFQSPVVPLRLQLMVNKSLSPFVPVDLEFLASYWLMTGDYL